MIFSIILCLFTNKPQKRIFIRFKTEKMFLLENLKTKKCTHSNEYVPSLQRRNRGETTKLLLQQLDVCIIAKAMNEVNAYFERK